MSADPNKKSARTFQCRDVLWETFEQMARELECSIDYLINESMKQYARQRSYSPRTPFPGTARVDGAPGPGPMPMQGGGNPPSTATPPPMGAGPQAPQQAQSGFGQGQGPPPMPGMSQGGPNAGPPPPPPVYP